MSYIPHEYWFKHGKTYKDEFRYNKNFELQEKILIGYLKTNVSSFSRVLEVGCGEDKDWPSSGDDGAAVCRGKRGAGAGCGTAADEADDDGEGCGPGLGGRGGKAG